MKATWKQLWLAFLSGFLLLSAGCGTDKAPQEQFRVIGEAFVGPMTLGIRKDLTPRSPEIADVKHGEKLELLERRRRFIRVRTKAGAIGWIDSRQLMTAEQIAKLEELAEQYADTVKIGQATVYDALNLHNEPNRQAPSFTQIPEKGVVDVIGYQLSPRVAYQAPPLIEEKKPTPRRSRKKGKKMEKDESLPLLPPPSAPELPDDWITLSQSPKEDDEKLNQPPVKMDDWTLVRMPDGKVGWALSSMLIMAIPDDVAQYSEGHRIMGYWPLGEVIDEGVKKNHWLWVTQSQKSVPFNFDGFRVFMYTTKRHRYEQAYRIKNIHGHFPVDVIQPGSKKDYLAEFSIITDENGQKILRHYAFLGYRVMTLEELPWTPSKEESQVSRKKGDSEPPFVPWWKRLFRKS